MGRRRADHRLDDGAALADLYAECGSSAALVALSLGVSASSVLRALRHHQIPAVGRERENASRRLKLDERELADAYGRGVSVRRIARELNVSPATVQARINELGLPSPMHHRARDCA